MCVFVMLSAWPYTVTGILLAKKSPVSDVVVKFFDEDDKEIGNAMTDKGGNFVIEDVDVDKFVVEISEDGYVPVKIEVTTDKTDIKLGIINLEEIVELNEVTVSANSRITTPGKMIVYASTVDKERAADPFNMLTLLAYKAPQIEVNESERTLTIAGRGPEVLVNGIKRPMSFISSIKPDAIERIEYSSIPDIRFGKCYINIITSRPEEGGWLMADIRAAVTTPRNFFSGVAEYAKGKNSFMLYYNGGYRHGRKEYIDQEEHYIESSKDITLSVDGQPSSTIDKYHNVSFYFTRVPSVKSMFEAAGGLNIHNNDRRINDIVKNLTESYKRENIRGFDNISPYLSLYYNFAASEKATVEIDAVGSYSHSSSYRNLSFSTGYDSRLSATSPLWHVSAEALWKQQLPFAWLNTGISFSHSKVTNKYIIDGTTTRQPLSSTNFKLYSSMGGQVFTVRYNLSVALKYFKVENGIITPDLMASIQKNFGNDLSVSYNFSYSPDMPSVSSYNDAVVPVNNLLYHIGSGKLKAAQDVYNRIYFQYNKDKFYISAQGSIDYMSNPFVTNFKYQSDMSRPLAGYFVEQTANGRNYISYGFNGSIGVSNLWNVLSFSASTGWNHSHLNASESYSVCAWDLSLNMGLYWNGWQLNMAAQNILPSWSMLATNQKYRDWPFTLLSLYKTFGKWKLSLSWGNIFSRYGGRYRTETLSAAVTRINDYRMNDQGNRIELGVRYQFVTGKLLNKKDRNVTSSSSGDNGVSWDY